MNTLLLYIPLLALTDGMTDGETIYSLRVGWRNLPTLRVGWRILFSSCAVVSVFLFWQKKGVGCTYYYVLGVSMYVDTLSILGPHSSPHPSITMCS